MIIDNVNVIIENGEMEEAEIKSYIKCITRKNKGKVLKNLELKIGGNYVDMKYSYHSIPFQRIRRITDDDRVKYG